MRKVYQWMKIKDFFHHNIEKNFESERKETENEEKLWENHRHQCEWAEWKALGKNLYNVEHNFHLNFSVSFGSCFWYITEKSGRKIYIHYSASGYTLIRRKFCEKVSLKFAKVDLNLTFVLHASQKAQIHGLIHANQTGYVWKFHLFHDCCCCVKKFFLTHPYILYIYIFFHFLHDTKITLLSDYVNTISLSSQMKVVKITNYSND